MRVLLFLLMITAQAVSALSPSQYWRDYYSPASLGEGAVPLPVGAVVQVYDPDGVECGRFDVHTPGSYGYLHVYGDDPLTPEDEGAISGDTLAFFVDGTEYVAVPPAVWLEGDRLQYRADIYHPESMNSLYGSVFYGTHGGPIEGAEVILTGTVDSVFLTNENGVFQYGPLPSGEHSLSVKCIPNCVAETFGPAYTSLDAAAVLRNIHQGRELPFDGLVADADGDGSVTVDDAAAILNRRVGFISAMPNEGSTYSNPAAVQFTYDGSTPPDPAWFEVRAVGDVTGNWPEADPLVPVENIGLTLPQMDVTQGEEITVTVRATARDVYGADLAFSVDTTYLTPGENLVFRHRFEMNANAMVRVRYEKGTVRFSVAADLPVSLNDGVLAEFAFTVKSDTPVGEATPLAWDADLTRINEFPPVLNDGELLVLPPGAARPEITSFDAGIISGVGSESDVLYPFMTATVTDENGVGTIDSVILSLPDGSTIEYTPTEDGEYNELLSQLESFEGGVYTLRVVDTIGLAATARDSVPALLPVRPELVSPEDSGTGVALTTKLDWEDVPGVAAYGVVLTAIDPEGAVSSFLNPAEALLHINTGVTTTSEQRIPDGMLGPDTTYYWAVGTVDRLSDMDHIVLSPIQSFTTENEIAPPAQPPALVSAPELVDRGVDELTFAWTTDVLSDTRIHYGFSSEAYTDTAIVNELVQRHSITITGLEPGTEYFVEIASRGGGGELKVPFNRAVYTRAAPDYNAPDFTAAPLVVHTGEDMAVITWENDEPTSFVLVLSSETGDTTVASEELIRAHRITVNGLTPDTEYAFTVEVTDAAGNGPSVRDGQTFRTKRAADTTAPRLLNRPVSVADQTTVVVVWSADEPHTAMLSVRTLEGVFVRQAFSETPQTTHTARITGLESSSTYEFVLSLTDLSGNVRTVRPYRFRTLRAADTTPPAFVRGPLVRYVSNRRVVLVWRTDEPTASYVELRTGVTYIDAISDGRLKRNHRLVLTQLSPGSLYDFTIFATDAAGNTAVFPKDEEPVGRAARIAGGRRSASLTTSTSPDVTPPALTSPPAVTARTATSLTIGWSTDETANSVVRFGEETTGRIARGSAEDLTESVSLSDFVTAHSVTITGLNPGTTYAYQIGSTDPSGNGETVSDVTTGQTLAQEDITPPSFVDQPVVVAQTDSRILVRWTTDEPSDSRVQYTLSGSSDDPDELYMSDLTTDHVITLTNLPASSSFDLTVQSTDLQGNGPASATLSASTLGSADILPPVISNLDIRTEDTRAWITWETDEPADAFAEYGETESLGLVVSDQEPSTTHELVLTNLSPSTQYYYRVASSDASDNTTTSAVVSLITSSVPDTDPPAQVQGVSLEEGATEVRLTWSANTDADLAGYTIERAVPDGVFAPIAQQVSFTQYLDVGLTPGQQYWYRVIAEDKAASRNAGQPSDAVTITPDYSSAPGQPPATSFTEAVSPQPTCATGDAAVNKRAISGYTFIVASDPALSNVIATKPGVPEGTQGTGWQVPFRLEDDTEYWWTVFAVDEAGFSGPLADITSFVVDVDVPVGVRLLSFAATAAPAGVMLEWQAALPKGNVVRLSRAAGDMEPISLVDNAQAGGRFFDGTALAGQDYLYHVESISPSGVVQHLGSVSATAALPREVELQQNVPNPFNPTTSVSYQLPYRSQVQLVVYNTAGQVVRSLVNDVRDAGFHTIVWDGCTATGSSAGSGVYLARLQVIGQTGSHGVETRTMRMVLLK